MSGFGNLFSFFRRRPISITRYKNNDVFYTYFDTAQANNSITTDLQKLQVIFSNPAMLKVVSLQCDTFSLGKYVDENGEEIQTPLLDKLKDPNFTQTERQFKWDFMLQLMVGTAYAYTNTQILSFNNPIYWLNIANVEFPDETLKELDKLMLTEERFNEIQDLKVKYTYRDGSSIDIELRQLKPFFDLTNGVGNWYKGNSRIDALYKIISNSEKALTSKNTNLEFSGKYIVSGNQKLADLGTPMGNLEKEDIRSKMRSGHVITPVKSEVDIKRFVEDMDELKLDDAYTESYFRIGNMYNIPREVLEINLKGGIGDKGNSEDKARAAHVTYTLQPKGDDMINGLAQYFGDKTKYRMSWDDQPFMQVSANEKAKVKETNSKAFKNYVDAGVTPESAAELLGLVDLQFKTADNETD